MVLGCFCVHFLAFLRIARPHLQQTIFLRSRHPSWDFSLPFFYKKSVHVTFEAYLFVKTCFYSKIGMVIK